MPSLASLVQACGTATVPSEGGVVDLALAAAASATSFARTWSGPVDVYAIVSSVRSRKGAAQEGQQEAEQGEVVCEEACLVAAAGTDQPAPKEHSSEGRFAPYRRGLRRHEAPAYVIYPYVTRGYTSGGSYTRCLRAAFEWHAETLNAWTMVFGCALSACLLNHAISSLRTAGASGGGSFWRGVPDEAPFWIMTAAVFLHAPWSIGFHLFRGINKAVYNFWRRLDQVFIFQVSQLLTLGISWFVYDSWWALTLNMVAAIITAQVATMDIWALPADYRRHRGGQVAFVGCIAACYWWPMGVQAAQDLWAWRGAAGLGPLAAGAAGLPSLAASVYTVGALVALAFGAATFALGVPERLLPGVFDTVGFSHQWMHVGASAAHVFEYLFVLEMWRRRTAAHAGA